MTVTVAIFVGVVLLWSGVAFKDKIITIAGVAFLIYACFVSIEQHNESEYNKKTLYQLKVPELTIIEPMQSNTNLIKACYKLRGCK